MGRGKVLLRATSLAAWALLAVMLGALGASPQDRQRLPEEAVTQLVTASLLRYFDPESRFEISVQGSALSGDVLKVDVLHVVGRPAVVRGFRGEVLLHAHGLELDFASLAGQQVVVRRVGKATGVGRITAKAVEEGLAKNSSAILNPKLHFQGGEFEASAVIRRSDRLYPTWARGTLAVENRQRVHVVVPEAKVAAGDVPRRLVESELAKLNPVLDLSKWPLGLRIERLTLHNDTAQMLATRGE
jgi:hypothetical protein